MNQVRVRSPQRFARNVLSAYRVYFCRVILSGAWRASLTFAIVFLFGFCAVAEDKPDDGSKTDPLKIKGPIQKIQNELAQLVNLRWLEGSLETKFPQSYDEAEDPIDAIREEFGYGEGSSYGSPTYRLGFGGTKLKGFIARTKNSSSGYRTQLTLREISKPYRSLSISTNERGDFTATIRSPDHAYLLRVRQQEDGQFVVQEIKNTEVFSSRVADFNAFMSSHRKFATERLLPALQEFGIGHLVSPFHENVQQRFLSQLEPLDADQQKNLANIIAKLNADQFSSREAATETIRSEFERNSEILFHVYLSREYLPEVRSRMRTVILDKAAQEDIDMIDFLASSRLTENVAYLVWLLESELSVEQHKLVMSQFRAVTKETVSPGSTAWKEWVAAQPFSSNPKIDSSDTGDEVDFPALLTQGVLKKANQHTPKLVRIKFNENNLALDREHWAKPFGGKSITALTKELEEEFAKRNMPKAWFNRGGHSSMSRTGHPQVLYELMCEALDGSSEEFIDEFDYFGETAGWELSFTASKLRTRLNIPVAKRRRRRGKKRNTTQKRIKPFHFYIEEQAKPYRVLAVDETNDSFAINIVCVPQDISIQLVQNENGILMQDIRGLEVRAMQEPTFRELYEKNKDYFQTEIFPLLQYMGVQFAPDVAAPLNVADGSAASTTSDKKQKNSSESDSTSSAKTTADKDHSHDHDK